MALLNSAAAKPVVRGNYFVPVIPIAYRERGRAVRHRPVPGSVLFGQAGGPRLEREDVLRRGVARQYLARRTRFRLGAQSTAPPTYYQDGCNGIGVLGPCPSHPTSRMGELLLAALDSISSGPGADTVWNRTTTTDRTVSPILVTTTAWWMWWPFCSPSSTEHAERPGIWSHRGTIGIWNNGQPYVTRTPRRDASGHPIPGQFLKVSSYTMQSAVGGDQACTGGVIMPIGTVTHETGHAFGLPDLYDTDPSSGTQGVGEWSLMSSGSYARPYSPSSFDAWSLVQLGWVNVDTLVSGLTRTAAPVQLSNTVYYASTVGSLYLLLENRGAVGTDTAQMNPAFSHAKQPGLLVWQIDDDRVQQGVLPVNRVNTGVAAGGGAHPGGRARSVAHTVRREPR